MDQFSKVSTPVKWIAVALATIGLVGAGVALGTGKWVFLLALLVLLVVLLGGYLLWLALRLRKKSAEFDSKVGELNAKSHLDVGTASERAEIDNARRKFERGVKEYRKSGQSLYVLPWYLLVGMPGSGKTWCVRQSEVGFLPGMQDEMQGIGGTQYMDWWFTKHAVILDTAGKYMIEGKGWQDFLNLLKKYRANCPINGVMLAIPASDLFQDSKTETAEKAKQIAYQIAMIQKVLDVSFPLFVVVTKCDLLPGFREFFDSLDDPRLRHQLFGWSNRAPLDAPFDPNWVNQHFDNVVSRLYRRRLGLLAKPLSSDAEQHRLDSMDRLYELPQNFLQMAAPLRVYVEEVFSGNVFACKPPFFRGLFFTTSMQEGVPVDLSMWIKLGIKPTPAIPGGEAAPIAQRDKAYFLRDLFLKKVFIEKGLVTTATNALRRRRNWRFAMLGGGAVALFLFLGIGMFGKKALRESITERSDHWKAAVVDWKTTESGARAWHPIVDRSTENDPWTYHGRDPIGQTDSLVRFHTKLMELIQKPPKISWVFRPLKWTVGGDLNERAAQRIVFEASILKPLVLAAREKLIAGPDKNETNPEEQQAYHQESVMAMESLFLIDNKILSRGMFSGGDAPTSQNADTNYLTPLLKFTSSDDSFSAEHSAELAKVMAWTYSKGDGAGKWPPVYFSGGDTLETNLALKYGFERLMIFPLVAPVTNNSDFLDGPAVQDFAGFMKLVEVNQTSWSSGTVLSHELQTRFDWLKPVIMTLVNPDTESLATCKIFLTGKQTPAASALLRRWRYVTLLSTNLSGVMERSSASTGTGTTDDALVGEVTVSQPLQITLRQFPEPGKNDLLLVAVPNWGPIRLWFNNHEANPDGNSCLVRVPVPGNGTSVFLELRLQFERPFPEKWPARYQVLGGASPD